MRIGMGYDVHKLVEGRDLIIGGVTIPYGKGLLGHSDADVLLHAIMDALLGAAALGDIGKDSVLDTAISACSRFRARLMKLGTVPSSNTKLSHFLRNIGGMINAKLRIVSKHCLRTNE